MIYDSIIFTSNLNTSCNTSFSWSLLCFILCFNWTRRNRVTKDCLLSEQLWAAKLCFNSKTFKKLILMDIQADLDNIIFLVLLIVTVISWGSLIYTNFAILSKLSFNGTIVANALLFLLLSFRWFNFGYFPLSNLYESLLFLAWDITFTTIANYYYLVYFVTIIRVLINHNDSNR